jgi:hypothetical protein
VYASWPRRLGGYLIDVAAFYAPWALLPAVNSIAPLDGERRPLWHAKRQTFADTAARSVVIKG